MLRRRQLRAAGWGLRRRRSGVVKRISKSQNGGRQQVKRQKSGTARTEQRLDLEPDDDDGGGELDEEDRELLGEVDASDSDMDEEMGDDWRR